MQSNPIRLKLLLVSPLPPPLGGIATWTSIVKEIVEKDPDVTLHIVDSATRWRAVTNLSLLPRLTGGAVQSITVAFRMVWALLRNKIDLVHICTSGGLATARDLVLVAAARLCGKKVVVHYHIGRLSEIAERRGFEFQLMRFVAELAGTIVVLGKRTAESFKSALRKRVRVVALPNPINIEQLPVSPPSTPQKRLIEIVFAGQVMPKKGPKELISACAQLPTSSIKLQMVGYVDPSYRNTLMDIAKTKEQGRWITFTGVLPRDEALKIIGKADIFVLPSINNWEAFPFVILEAMALERAIVASEVGAIPEMLDRDGPEECGLTVPPGDVTALKNALSRLIADSSMRSSLGKKAAQRVFNHYSVGPAYRNLKDLWFSIVKPGV